MLIVSRVNNTSVNYIRRGTIAPKAEVSETLRDAAATPSVVVSLNPFLNIISCTIVVIANHTETIRVEMITSHFECSEE